MAQKRSTSSPVKQSFADRVSGAIDQTLDVLSPRRAAMRRYYKAQSSLLKFAGYEGAKTDRTRGYWDPGAGSADEELLDALPKLRERSRDLARNNGDARGLIETITLNVIGSGIVPQCRVDVDALGLTDEQADEFKTVVEREFDTWASDPDKSADYEGRCNFWEIERLAMEQLIESGEFLCLRQRVNRDGVPLALHMIEPDRLDDPDGDDKVQGGGIRGGVELGSRGEPTAYHIRKAHPGDTSFTTASSQAENFERVALHDSDGIRNVLHGYEVHRPGQSRGVPIFAPILSTFKHLAAYEEAELVAARLSACIGMIHKTSDPQAAAIARTTSTNSASQRIEEIQPGMIKRIGMNESIDSFNPSRPNSGYGDFVDRLHRQICAAMKVSYEMGTNDFRNSTYTSARAGLLQSCKQFKRWQQFIAEELVRPVWEWFLLEAFLAGKLPSFCDGTFMEQRAEWSRMGCTLPGWDWVDPEKEMKAAFGLVKGGMSSLTEQCMIRGKDIEDVVRDRAAEKALFASYGLEDPIDAERNAKSVAPASNAGDGDEDGTIPDKGEDDGNDEAE